MRRLFYDGDWLRVWVLCAVSVAAVAVVALGTAFIANRVDEATCRQVAAKAGNPTKHAMMSGCWVKVDGRWVPYDKWIVNTGK